MNKKGFVSTTLIYTIFVIILSLMVYLMISYSNDRLINNKVNSDARNDFIISDITLEIFEHNKENSYKKVQKIPVGKDITVLNESKNICSVDNGDLVFKTNGICKISYEGES